MTFHTLALVTCVAALLLGIGWVVAGRLMLQRWRVEPSAGALLVGRRIGVIYLGVALLFYLTRATESRELITIVSTFAALANALLAGLGLYEYRARRVGRAILVSVAFELLLVVGFGSLLLTAAGTWLD
jgi:Kef-type K+ transport system membrane component KefB